MLFSGGGKNTKIKAVYFSFESSQLRESRELTALGYKETQGEIGPMQTTGTGLVHKFLRIDTLLQV